MLLFAGPRREKCDPLFQTTERPSSSAAEREERLSYFSYVYIYIYIYVCICISSQLPSHFAHHGAWMPSHGHSTPLSRAPLPRAGDERDGWDEWTDVRLICLRSSCAIAKLTLTQEWQGQRLPWTSFTF
jgi:hypothetical protein